MNMQSLVFGFLLGVIIASSTMFGVIMWRGASRADTADSKADAPVGRFLVQTSVQHAFVVDTVTGQVWETLFSIQPGI